MILMLKLFASLFTAVFGIWAVLKPYSAAKLVGLSLSITLGKIEHENKKVKQFAFLKLFVYTYD